MSKDSLIPKTVKEAKKQVIELYKKYKESQSKSDNIIVTLTDESRQARNNLERYNLALYSLPWFKPLMKAWMVDVKFGNENPFGSHLYRDKHKVFKRDSEEKIRLLVETPGQFTEQQAGSLGKSVQDYIMNELGLIITDRGGLCGSCGGHIGCPCTDAQMELMINSINIHFKKAVDAGMMAVKIAWFKPGFFLNDNEMDEYIESNK